MPTQKSPLPFLYSEETFLLKKCKKCHYLELLLLRGWLASLQRNHDDDLDFMKEKKRPLAKLPEWLVVVIRWKFLWWTISCASVTGTVRPRVQDILLISFVTGWLKTRKRFRWKFSEMQMLGYLKSRYYERSHFCHSVNFKKEFREFWIDPETGSLRKIEDKSSVEVYCWHAVPELFRLNNRLNGMCRLSPKFF